MKIMMRSMFSGVSGLRVHQTRMDVIAHNIANVNTPGFKASMMTFTEAFSQTLQGATAPNPALARGGTNPQQIGLGVNAGNISRIMTRGGAQRTDNPFHVMIEGDGFFVVGDDVGGLLFTRDGSFDQDEFGTIHLNGLPVRGWPASMGPPPGPPIMGPVAPIVIGPDMQFAQPNATSSIQFVDSNLRRGGGIVPSSINVFDSQGNSYTIGVTFVPGATINTWTVEFSTTMRRDEDGLEIELTDAGLSEIPDFTLIFQENGRLNIDAAGGTADGGIFTFPFDGTALGVNFGAQAPGAAAGAPGQITIDFTQMTQFGGLASSAIARDDNGRPAGTLDRLSIGGDGVITGTYSNGETIVLWQIAMANFVNPGGLESVGNNLFAQTSNSGIFDGIGNTPGAFGMQLLVGTLESSNVDLASEFTQMIVTQRGFQANSRSITTSDEMLQILVNL